MGKILKIGLDLFFKLLFIQFCDLETKVEYRLVTNLPKLGEAGISNEEVMDIYRCRWGIELLWKFLKMHLKLDHLITKNVNGIAIQLYATLIAYLILQLVEIPQIWGDKLLDKLRYLQAAYVPRNQLRALDGKYFVKLSILAVLEIV